MVSFAHNFDSYNYFVTSLHNFTQMKKALLPTAPRQPPIIDAL